MTENLRLLVKNTFLHAEDVDDAARKVSRSRSEDSLSQSSSSRTSESGSGPPARALQDRLIHSVNPPGAASRLEPDPILGRSHHIYSTSSSTSQSQESDALQPWPEAPATLNQSSSSQVSPSAAASRPPGVRYSPDGKEILRWSAGSELHALGECSPCAWLWRPVGCIKEASCSFCHACPPGEVKRRCKARAARLKDLQAVEIPEADSGNPVDRVPVASASSRTELLQ